MELELGLALRRNHDDPTQGFDLNERWFEPEDVWSCSHGLRQGDPTLTESYSYNKRQKFEEGDLEISLGGNWQKRSNSGLVSWNEEPNEEDDDEYSRCQLVHPIKNLEDDDGDSYVKGWPPIQSWRKTLLPLYCDRNRTCRGSNSMYIKVKMEGVAIGRKINLRCYESYDALFSSLIAMFAKYMENGDESTNMFEHYYKMKFKGRDGSWSQANGTPWQTFVDCVERIEIVRR